MFDARVSLFTRRRSAAADSRDTSAMNKLMMSLNKLILKAKTLAPCPGARVWFVTRITQCVYVLCFPRNRGRASRLFSYGSFNRAGCCASAAIDTFVLVDFVLSVLFADSGYGTIFCTCTTTDASVCNYVCH